MRDFSFEKLVAYQKAKEYVVIVYDIIKQLPSEEKYGLCDQLRRASVSIVSNIAEGTSRVAIKEKIHFVDIAYGSLMETYSQLDVSKDLHYISDTELETVKNKAFELVRLLASLKNSYKKAAELQCRATKSQF